MTRGQIDLIDMRHRPDHSYHWIGHYMDHWSKMHVLFPLMQKSANEVALNLASKVFAYFGPPKILQSDNGREFVNTIVHKLVEDWPGEVTIVNGRARHPQSQLHLLSRYAVAITHVTLR
jgi:transposase InsO family protein